MALPRMVLAIVAGAVMLATPGVSQAAAGGTEPSLTVVGFGVVNVPAGQVAAPQLELNVSVHGATASSALSVLDRDLSRMERRLEEMGIAAAELDAQGPPQLGYVTATGRASCRKAQAIKPGLSCPTPGYDASETLQATFPTLASLARVLSGTRLVHRRGVQSFWINQGSAQPGRPTAAALAAGYRAALADARRTAAAIARADGLTLGAVVSVAEGAASTAQGCAMGGCAGSVGISVPSVDASQMLVAVTVTYAARPRDR